MIENFLARIAKVVNGKPAVSAWCDAHGPTGREADK